MAIKMTERHEQEYYKVAVEPLLAEADATLLGDITPEQKFDLYKKASATLFTSQWEEPFGLVMPESMACGTPVVAFNRGAAPEVILDGATGFLCDTEEEMVAAVGKIDKIDAKACRDHVAGHFSAEKMADGYESVYHEVLTGQKHAVLVRDIMTTKVVSIQPSATREELLRRMATHHVGGLPVVNGDGQLVGIVTDADVLGKIGETVSDIMTKAVITVTEEDTIQRAASVLTRNRIERAPVTRDGTMIGIISRSNLVKALAF